MKTQLSLFYMRKVKPHVTPQLIAETKAKYGLDQPLLIQYKIG